MRFPVNIVKLLRTPILRNTSEWLLLENAASECHEDLENTVFDDKLKYIQAKPTRGDMKKKYQINPSFSDN